MKRFLCFVLLLFCLPPLPLFAQDAKDWKILQDAQTLVAGEKFGEAEKLLKELLERQPNFGHAHQILGHAQYLGNKHPEARQSLVKAIECGRITVDILNIMLNIDMEEDNTAAILGDLQLLSVLEPENITWKLRRADLLADSGQFWTAQSILEEVLKEHPEKREVLLRMGNVLMPQSKTHEAIVCFETAFHLGHHDEQLARTISELWQQEGNSAEALNWYDRALLMAGEKDWAFSLRRAQLAFSIMDLPRARDAAAEIKNGTDSAKRLQALILLGQIEMADANAEKAVAIWEEAVAEGSQSIQLYAYLGAHYFNQQNHKKASEYLGLQIEKGGVEEEPLHSLILSQIYDKQTNAAKDSIKTYIGHFGLTQKARQFIRLLDLEKKP